MNFTIKECKDLKMRSIFLVSSMPFCQVFCPRPQLDSNLIALCKSMRNSGLEKSYKGDH